MTREPFDGDTDTVFTNECFNDNIPVTTEKKKKLNLDI